jgi:hypothetical protein
MRKQVTISCRLKSRRVCRRPVISLKKSDLGLSLGFIAKYGLEKAQRLKLSYDGQRKRLPFGPAIRLHMNREASNWRRVSFLSAIALTEFGLDVQSHYGAYDAKRI